MAKDTATFAISPYVLALVQHDCSVQIASAGNDSALQALGDDDELDLIWNPGTVADWGILSQGRDRSFPRGE